MFEGSPEQMLHSLNKLKRLPDNTLVYCTHEYTQSNVRFALEVEPENQNLQNYSSWVDKKREMGMPTLPSNLAEQKQINPFLRSHELSVQTAAEAYCEKKTWATM